MRKSGKELSSARKEKCIECGCTENKACKGGCSWIAPNYCSACDTEGAFSERFVVQWCKTFGSYSGDDTEPNEMFEFMLRERRYSRAISYTKGLEQLKDIQDYRIKSAPKKKQKSNA